VCVCVCVFVCYGNHLRYTSSYLVAMLVLPAHNICILHCLLRVMYLTHMPFGISLLSVSFVVRDATLTLSIKWPSVITGLMMEILMACAVVYPLS
jgi:hypothetical protein